MRKACRERGGKSATGYTGGGARNTNDADGSTRCIWIRSTWVRHRTFITELAITRDNRLFPFRHLGAAVLQSRWLYSGCSTLNMSHDDGLAG